MSSHINPKFNRNPLENDETILLQIDAENPLVFTPKRLKWNEITIPKEFNINELQPPRNIIRGEPSEIIESEDED